MTWISDSRRAKIAHGYSGILRVVLYCFLFEPHDPRRLSTTKKALQDRGRHPEMAKKENTPDDMRPQERKERAGM
jgi:hypothetical protein